MLLFKFILLSFFFFFCLYFFLHGRSRFLCPDVTLMYILLSFFSLYNLLWNSFFFSYHFSLPVSIRYSKKKNHKSLSFYHITICPSLCYSFLSRNFSLIRSLYSFFFSYIISLFSMYLFVSPCFLFYVHYSIYFFHFSLYLSYSFYKFVLALKRNKYTDSEMDTLVVVHFDPLITRDHWRTVGGGGGGGGLEALAPPPPQ